MMHSNRNCGGGLLQIKTLLLIPSMILYLLLNCVMAVGDPIAKSMPNSNNIPNISHSSGQEQLLTTEDNQQSHWFFKLLIILFGYVTIIVPILSIVYLVKHKMCFPIFQNFSLLKIFVFGKQLTIVEDEMESQLLPDDENKEDQAAPKRVSSASTSINHSLRLVYCFFGLQISYLTWGLIQEKIMTTEYTVYREKLTASVDDTVTQIKVMEPDTLHFKDSQFLVLVNRVLAFVFALIAIFFNEYSGQTKSRKVLRSRAYLIAPLYEFVYCSLSNVLSSWCQYEALKYVNFPTQVLSKACKLLAVMLMSQIVNKKSYKPLEYVFALSITFGMIFFLLGNHRIETNYAKLHINTQEQTHSYHLIDGLVILALYVTFDAFTSNWQGKLFDKYAISSSQMMAAVNFYSILLTATSSFEQGDLWPSLKLLCECPALLKDCLLLSICSASGQMFVFHTISTFGPLVFTTIMTLRQAFAILLSCLIYKHPLSWISSLGILMVFATLFYQIYWKNRLNCKESKSKT